MKREAFEAAEKCLAFIDKSVSCFHAVENIAECLEKKGLTKLEEREAWELKRGKGYFVKRNDSSLIAFRIPAGETKGFHITASHSDSPAFKLKAKAEIPVEDNYIKLNVEPYGGMIYAPWLDRCLSVAGRIICRREGKLESRTVNIDEDLLIIPNQAIHMNREMNSSLSYNPQTDLQPLMSAWKEEEPEDKEEKSSILTRRIASCAGVREEEILGSDLFLYVREKGRLAGFGGELMVSPRLDDLECVFASLEAFLETEPEETVSVLAVFDNEEVGSHTKQGAASTFLEDVLSRTGEALGKTGSAYRRMLAESFMISADNAHGVHPNHPETSDVACRPYLNGGIVIKYHGGQRYTTDAYSEAVMKDVCDKAGVPWQVFCNRSDKQGGSTLGNVSAGQVSIPTVDIGLAQLAMHSAVETAGSKDVEYLIRALKAFYEK